MNTTTPRPATEKQVEFIKSLLTDIAETGDEGRQYARSIWALLRENEERVGLTASRASNTIDVLLGKKKALGAVAPVKKHSVPSRMKEFTHRHR